MFLGMETALCPPSKCVETRVGAKNRCHCKKETSHVANDVIMLPDHGFSKHPYYGLQITCRFSSLKRLQEF